MVRLPLTPDDVERGRRLGALLRQARGERTVLAVALDAGVSPETLRKIESGRVATPAFPTVAAVAEVLGLSLDAVWAELRRTEGPAHDRLAAGDQAALRHVLRDDRARRDDRVPPDRDARQDRRPRADPHVLPDVDRAAGEP